MATKNDPTTQPPSDDAAPPAPPAPATPASAPSGVPKALAITGIAVGAALLLGLTFAGGVTVGRVLPDGRGPGGPAAMGPLGDRGEQLDRMGEQIEQRMDERMDNRDERRDERRAQFEQWLQEQGIDPNAPAEPTE